MVKMRFTSKVGQDYVTNWTFKDATEMMSLRLDTWADTAYVPSDKQCPKCLDNNYKIEHLIKCTNNIEEISIQNPSREILEHLRNTKKYIKILSAPTE